MVAVPSRLRPLLRLLRVALVVVPILLLGFSLGLGRLARSLSRAPAPVAVRTPSPPRLDLVSPSGRAHPAGKTPIRVRCDQGESLRISGGRLARVELRTTPLRPREALRQYQESFRRRGWKPAPEFSNMVDSPSPDILLRFFLRAGRVRLLLVSPQANTDRHGGEQRHAHGMTGSAITIFDGDLRRRSDPRRQ